MWFRVILEEHVHDLNPKYNAYRFVVTSQHQYLPVVTSG
jgi:hypothetical protein